MAARGQSNIAKDQQPVRATNVAAFSVWLIGILLLSAIPVGAGIFVTTLIPELGAINSDLQPWLVHLTVGVVIGWLILSEIAEFIIKLSVANKHKLAQEILSISC